MPAPPGAGLTTIFCPTILTHGPSVDQDIGWLLPPLFIWQRALSEYAVEARCLNPVLKLLLGFEHLSIGNSVAVL